MKRNDLEYTVKVDGLNTVCFTHRDSSGCVVGLCCVCTYATGTWKVWKPNGTIVFCGAIVYTTRACGLVSYTLIGTKATGTVTFATAVACDTITVNGLLYTGVAGAKADNTQFSIDTSNCAAATDFSLSVTDDTRTGITVTARDVTSTAVAAVSTLRTTQNGTLGNCIPLVSSCMCTVAVSGALFTNGTGNAVVCCAGIWEGEVEFINCSCEVIDQGRSFTFTIQESF